MKAFMTALFLCAVFVSAVIAALVDTHESCEFWASIGECDKNPNYMLPNCAKSCSAIASANSGPIPASFYDIVEKDIDGNEVRFDSFRGKVVYIVNVASYCGYTESNYADIKRLQKYTDAGLVTLLAPCNAFGAQEPGSADAIKSFATGKGYQGLLLAKDEVNGQHARPSFRYLKSVTGKSHVAWNFDGKFLIDRRGNARITDAATLEDDIQELLSEPAEEL